jgi:phosphatidylglycerophosphate synthase
LRGRPFAVDLVRTQERWIVVSNLITSIRLVLLAPILFFLLSTANNDRWIALALFLAAGLTDIIDGRVARALNEVSRAGAMLDLISDRLLTLTVVAGLIASSELRGPFVFAAAIFVARDLTVASFGETEPGLGFRVSFVERAKISLQFATFALLMAPPILSIGPVGQYDLGRWLLVTGAILAGFTTVQYARTVASRLRRQVA